MKTQYIILPMALLVAVFSPSIFAGTYSGGIGEPNDPYRIATAEDINDIGNHVEDFNKCFVMVADINLADYTGTQFNIIGNDSNSFVGVFDGNDHTISNFTYISSVTDYVGLFRSIGPGGEIRNLKLKNVNINGKIYVGGLSGYLSEGNIINCSVQGNITGYGESGGHGGVCGLVGYIVGKSIVSNCYSEGDITGQWNVGGLIGAFWGTDLNYGVYNSYSTANIHSDFVQTGGLMGYGGGMTLSNCYATGNVDTNTVTGVNTGGLIGGFDQGKVINCYATGNITGRNGVGGLIGSGDSYSIINSYATGDVTGSEWNIGGLAGHASGTVLNSYAIGDVNGNEHVGGLIGNWGHQGHPEWTVNNTFSTGYVIGNTNTGGLIGSVDYADCNDSYWDIETSGQSTSACGEGKTTAEMKQKATFTNWDFVETWGIEDNQIYPFLKLTYPVGDLDLDKKVDFIDFAIFANHWLEGVTP